MFPEIETDTKPFIVQACSQKSGEFKTLDLTEFIDEKCYEVTGLTKQASDELIRLESSRVELRRWGAKFEANSQRPYFERHERDDIIGHRTEFINYFFSIQEVLLHNNG